MYGMIVVGMATVLTLTTVVGTEVASVFVLNCVNVAVISTVSVLGGVNDETKMVDVVGRKMITVFMLCGEIGI